VISPDLQNERKLVVEAAHSMIDLWGFPDWNHTAFILRSMAGVIRSLAQAALPCLPDSTNIPFRIWRSRGM